MIGCLELNEIEDLLLSEVVGRIGCHGDDKTLIIPVTYAYDGHRIVGHTTMGEKVRMMRANPAVCFEVDVINDLRNWRSVVVQGQYKELHGQETSVAMGFLVDKVMPKMPSETAMLGHGGRTIKPQHATESETIVFSIEVEQKSGRFEKEEK